jgi:hypothetical protein
MQPLLRRCRLCLQLRTTALFPSLIRWFVLGQRRRCGNCSSTGRGALLVKLHGRSWMSKWFYDTSTGTATRAVRCGSLLERAWLAQGISYEETQWTRGFMWFRPPERNALRPRENGSCIAVCCSSVGFALVILTFAWPLIAQGHGKYNVTQGPTCGPEVVGSLRTQVLHAWCSK